MSDYFFSNSPPDVPHSGVPVRRRPKSGGPQMPPWYLSPAEQLALAQQEAETYYGPLLAELRRQQDRLRQSHLAQQAGLTQLYSILAGSLGGAGQDYMGAFNNAANTLGRYSEGATSPDAATAANALRQEGSAYAGGAQALPQIAGQEGTLRFLKAVQEGNADEGDLAAKLAEVESGIPAKAQDLLRQIQNQQFQYGRYDQQQANADRAYGLSSLRAAEGMAARLSRPASQGGTGYLYVVGANGNIVQARDVKGQPISTSGLTDYQRANLTARQQAQASTNTYRQASLAQGEERIAVSGQRAAQAGKAKPPKQPTPNQVNTLVDQWYAGKRSMKRVKAPELDANGNPVYQTVPGGVSGQLSYQQAYKRLRAMHVPDATARTMLDTRWKRGERGRPWLSTTERNLLKGARVKATASYYQGYAYLTDAQVKVLQAAGALPAGEWVTPRAKGFPTGPPRYYIKPGY